jgi:hypothetical protein
MAEAVKGKTDLYEKLPPTRQDIDENLVGLKMCSFGQ